MESLARFIPDCLVLLRRLLADPRVPRRGRVVLVGLVAYLAMPIDLIPDFIPVVGQLDDVLVAALALRYAVRIAGLDVLTEHWPGPRESLELVIRLAYGKGAGSGHHVCAGVVAVPRAAGHGEPGHGFGSRRDSDP